MTSIKNIKKRRRSPGHGIGALGNPAQARLRENVQRVSDYPLPFLVLPVVF